MHYILIITTLCLFTVFYNVESKLTIEGIRKMMKGVKMPCLQETGMTEEQLEATYRGEFERVPEVMCFYKCIFQKLKVIKGDKLNVEMAKANIKAMIHPDFVEPLTDVINHCQHLIDQEDLCEASFDYVKCTFERNPDFYFY